MKRETTTLILTVLALTILGVLMVYSVSGAKPDSDARLIRQLVYVFIGLGGMYLCARFDYHRLADPWIYRIVVLVTLVLLVLVLHPRIGLEINSARRWISLGGLQFQPSEIAKFALILLLAVKLSENQDHIRSFSKGFLPAILIGVSFSALVCLEGDLGVPMLMMGTTMVMMLLAGVRLRYWFGGMAPLTAAVAALAILSPYRMLRLVAFLDPWRDRGESGYQLIQSFFSFAQGGAWGRGAGAGEQKLNFLPMAESDFIFSIVGEDLGLVGTLAVVALFLIFSVAAFRIALHASDLFGGLLAAGIAFLITAQATFIMAVTTGLLPTKGVPLPFISAGGTALVALLSMAGILVNVGVQAIPKKAAGTRAKGRPIPKKGFRACA
jgi:cell division protein FtsW